MSKIVLDAEPREIIGKRVKQLRRQGLVPAVIYGSHIDPIAITLNFRDLSKALSGLTASSLITIKVKGTEHNTLVRDRQMDYIRNEIIHVDFQAVSLTEKIRANVVILSEGTSPAVKDFSAVIVTGISEIEVEALPQELPEKFVVDLSVLKEIGDSITVKDLDIPGNVELLTDPEEVLFVATSMATEMVEEEEGEEEELLGEETSEPEVIERGKRTDEFED